LLTQFLKVKIKPVAEMVSHRLRHRHTSRRSDSLEPRCDVYSITEHIISLHDDVAYVNPNAQLNRSVVGQIGVARLHPLLDLDRTGDSIYDTWEFGQRPVAGQLEDTTLVFSNLRVDQLGPERLQSGQRADFIATHEPAVTDNIGSENAS
jgi:hypothetical protein